MGLGGASVRMVAFQIRFGGLQGFFAGKPVAAVDVPVLTIQSGR